MSGMGGSSSSSIDGSSSGCGRGIPKSRSGGITLVASGVADDSIPAVHLRSKPSRPLTADEIIRAKKRRLLIGGGDLKELGEGKSKELVGEEMRV